MAKWGEGDPRWIVEDRTDGTNVNNWHWTEKNATEWSKAKLKQLLADIQFSDPTVGNCNTTEVSSITGEASASNRKAKLIFFYEFNLTIKWTGRTLDDVVLNGTISIPNLSEENDVDEVDITVSMSSESTPDRNKVHALMKKQGPPEIRRRLTAWLKALREEYSQDLVLPTVVKTPVDRTPVLIHSQSTSPAAVPAKSTSASVASSASTSAANGLSVTTVELSETFQCSASDLFQSIVQEDRVRAYTQSDAKIDAKIGGKFSIFGGQVTGVFKEFVPFERIVQAWRFTSWPDGHYSEVTLLITEKGNESFLRLKQTDVPVADAARVEHGWRELQWQRAKVILGLGSSISMPF